MSVDIVFNCYEKTLERVLDRGFLDAVCADNRHAFAHRFVVINNVRDEAAVRRRAEALKQAGAIHDYALVSEHLGRALASVGLSRRDLGRIPQYSDWAFVALLLPRSEYFVHWDADVRLLAPADWVGPALDIMRRDEAVFVANPLWTSDEDAVRRETLSEDDRAFYSQGFSDQVYLVRTAELRQPIYRRFHWYSARYPLYSISPIYESRVDSYMRATGRLRISLKHAVYRHPREEEGGSYPTALQPVEHLRRLAYGALFKLNRTIHPSYR